MAKDTRKSKNPEKPENQAPDQVEKKSKALPDHVMDTLKQSLTEFDKMSEEKRVELFGDQKFLDQFWMYFKDKNKDILGQVKKEDMPELLTILEHKGFSIANLTKNADKLHTEFSPDKPEREVMEQTLEKFDDFCKDSLNNMPTGVFKDFARAVGFNPDTYDIDPKGKLKTIEDINLLWNKYVEKENITLKDTQKKNIEDVLCPDYDPVERIMVQVAIEKIGKELEGELKKSFDKVFAGKITAFSPIANLLDFKNEWLNFLQVHAHQIDQSLAKKLDRIIVTNGDIKRTLIASGRKFDASVGYGEWERYFRIVYNKLATRQLFDEIKETREAIESRIDVVVSAVKGFPPYVNEIFKTYPYDDKKVVEYTPNLPSQMKLAEQQVMDVDAKITAAKADTEKKLLLVKSDAEKKFLLAQADKEMRFLIAEKRRLRGDMERIRWNAYLTYLKTKNTLLADVMKTVIENHFNFSVLTVQQQQVIVNALVETKLKDLIKNKAPELLGVDEDEMDMFVHNLFDLQKKDLTISTKDGPVHIKFGEKGFLSHKVDGFLALDELTTLQNLPLSFTIIPTPTSEDFFEDSVIFQSLFPTFKAKNGRCKLNDGYKVKLTKDGQTVQGYLSQYPPDGDQQTASTNPQLGKENRYMYSQPISSPSQERSLVTWDDTPNGEGVVITSLDESECDIEIINKSFALTGESIGALLFGYVLGQHSFLDDLTLEEKEALGGRMDKIHTYMDTEDKDLSKVRELEYTDPDVPQENKVERKESSEKEAFFKAWDDIKGYRFDGQQYKKTHGVQPGTKIVIKAGETLLPPTQTSGSEYWKLEIIKVNESKGTLTFKIFGGETGIGKYEQAQKEVPMNGDTIQNIKDCFGDDLYKVPDYRKDNPEEQLTLLKETGVIDSGLYSIGMDKVKWNGDAYTFVGDEFAGKEVEYFGYDAKEYVHEDGVNPQSGKSEVYTHAKIVPIYFKYKHNSDGTFTVSSDDVKMEGGGSYKHDMDPHMFMLFVTSKKLEPKTNKQMQESKELKSVDEDKEFHRRKPSYSINNIFAFAKNTFTKITDSVKKYDEERTEELTDIVLKDGKLLSDFGKLRAPLSHRIGEGFENMGMDYYTDRDDRVWKKIEKWQKVFEKDAHFPTFYRDILDKMVSKGERPKDIYKIPAMLLALVNKEKNPYARGASKFLGKGMRVNLMLGKQHQEKYLSILNKKLAEWKQQAELYGIDWTIYMNDQITRLEMKYLIDTIDMREHGFRPDERYLCRKWSRKFTFTLEDALKKNFSHSTVEEKYKGLPKTMDFDFATFEYNRHFGGNKYGKAIPFLKMMAEQAQNEQQWEIFDMHVSAGLLSGLYLYHTDAMTKGWLKDVCRTRGFVPGIWMKDIHQQSKMLRMLNIFSGGEFQKTTGYDVENFQIGKFTVLPDPNDGLPGVSGLGKFSEKTFQKWRYTNNNGRRFCRFLEFVSSGVNTDKKTLITLSQDPSIPQSDRALLQEYINNTQETSQDIDKEVRRNPMAHAGSPFTKCETMVGELMKYDEGEFAGEDSHIKAGPQEFWKQVAHNLPKGRVSNLADLEFYVSKFLNRFEHYGFTGTARTVFLRRLRTVKNMMASTNPQTRRQGEDTLWYSICGVIIKNFSGGHGTPPDEFKVALDAFKNLFRDNIDTILSPSFLATTMGDSYVKDALANKPYEIEDWGEYIKVVQDRTSVIGNEANKATTSRFKSDERVIYDELYGVAEAIKTGHNEANRFRKYYEYSENKEKVTATPATQSQSQRGSRSKSAIKINNASALKSMMGGKSKKEVTKPSDDATLMVLDDEYGMTA